MADWYGHARSNYFAVKDIEAFAKALEGVEIEVYEGTAENEGKITLLARTENGGWPSWVYDEAVDDDVEFDISSVVGDHLPDGEVAVFFEVGAEKLRYVSGRACAVNNRGEFVSIDLEEIYKLARQNLGADTVATY